MDGVPKFTPIEKDKTPYIPEFTIINNTLNDVANDLNNVESMNNSELLEMIRKDYYLFLDDKYLLDYNYRQAVIDVFSNKKFLKGLIKVLSEEILTEKVITCCNKVTWDYMCQIDRDQETSDLLLKLSDTVNRQVINLLCAHVSAKTAQLIALARYSSFKTSKNITRTNLVITKYAKGITVQKIVGIYGILFRYIRLTNVFNAIMFDTNTEGFNADQLERYGMISTALLEILEHGMSSRDIMLILTNYYNELSYEARSIRFSMYSNSQIDYPRIYAVLDQLKAQNVSIP